MNRRDRKNSKAAKRRERIRREKHRIRQAPLSFGLLDGSDTEIEGEADSPFDEDDSAGALPPISTIGSERFLGRIQSLLMKSGAKDIAEANALLDTLDPDIFGDDDGEYPDDPFEQAQELAYDAMEAATEREARKLINQALQLDPDCVDALVQLAEMSLKPAEMHKLAERAVAAAERRLGEEFFEENKGHFWGILETRPYMRARHCLALAMIGRFQVPEAIGHFEAMIELCSNDNMGVRLELLPLYLLVDQAEKAAGLLARFEDDINPIMTWGGTLVHYLRRDFAKAKVSLAAARKWSPQVEKYLTHEKDLPRRRSSSWTSGSEDEAISAAGILCEAWDMYPMAIVWLRFGGRPGDGKYWGLATEPPPRSWRS